MASNLVWIEVGQEGTSDQQAHVRAHAARVGRRRLRDQKIPAASNDYYRPSRNKSAGERGCRTNCGDQRPQKWIPIRPNLVHSQISTSITSKDHEVSGKDDCTAKLTSQSSDSEDSSSDSTKHAAHDLKWQMIRLHNELPKSMTRSGMGIDLMTNCFAENYFATDSFLLEAVFVRHRTWLQPRSKSMEEAIYAIGLLQIGSTNRNDDVDWQARRHYGMMLQALLRDLESSEIDFTTVIAAALEVLLCQVYQTVSEDVVSWPTHVLWLVQLIKRSGNVLFTSKMGRISYETACMIELTHSLVLRKPFRLDISSWIEPELHLVTGEVQELFRLAAGLPALLHQVDRIIPSKASEIRLVSMARQLHEMDHRFMRWFEDYRKTRARCVDGGDKPFGISRLPPSRDLPLPLLSPTFRDELYFQSHHAANLHAMYWECLLLLRMAMQKVRVSLTTNLNEVPTGFEERHFVDEACACANLLCRAMPYLLRSAGGNVSQAASVRLPIYFAKEVFASSMAFAAELEWCITAEIQLQGHFRTIQWNALLPWAYLALIWQPFESPGDLIAPVGEAVGD